jgi:protein-L-isoaspartate(D-aspartate) O-methyltransferase
MNIEQARFNMIEQQIRPWLLHDDSVLDLLSVVKREDFVPQSLKGQAFADLAIPLLGSSDEALTLGQSMLEPRLEARMLQDLAVQPTETVLEVGSGSGYMAALLGKKAQRVLSLEIVPELVTQARENLAKAGIHNVEVRQADGAKMTDADGSFDVIAMSGSVTEVPHALLKLLKVGGRLGAFVGDEPVMRATVVTRNSATDFTTLQAWETVAPRLRNFPEPSRFKF